MIEWWNQLLLAQQIFALIAIPSTLILIIQTILTLIGMGGDGGSDVGDGVDTDAGIDTDTDVDTDTPDNIDAPVADDGLALFSLRGILSMLCIAGWVGVALLETSLPEWAAILIAAACGFATLVGMAFLMRAVYKLQSSGNIDVGNCIGKVAEVYLTIPPSGTGSGKVNVTVQEKYCEFTAITTSSEPLKTGSYVRVVAVNEAGVLLVEPLQSK
jgi:membrane protein implicated in regulation of membrane protease activity